MSSITFIIPSINRDTLTNSINSLIRQTNKNWECIIVFDGVEGIKFYDNRIKTININKLGKKGNGHGNAGLVRNEGIKICETEWIGFLDDDDTIHPNYVKTLNEKYLKNDFVVWRMKYQNGLIVPPLFSNDLVFARVGISFCYKNKFDNLLFDKNRDGGFSRFFNEVKIFN